MDKAFQILPIVIRKIQVHLLGKLILLSGSANYGCPRTPSDTHPLPSLNSPTWDQLLLFLHAELPIELGQSALCSKSWKIQGPIYQSGEANTIQAMCVNRVSRNHLSGIAISSPFLLCFSDIGARLFFLISFFGALWLKGKMSEVIYY